MTPLPTVPNVVQAKAFYSVGSDLSALNRVFIQYTGTPPNSAACAAMASSLYTDWAAEVPPYMHTDNALTGIEITDLSSTSGGSGTHTHTTAGTLNGNPLPAGNCMLASLSIPRRYRGGKPRTYFPVGDGNQINNPQQWKSTFVTNFQASLAALITDIAAIASGGCTLTTLCNISYYSGFTSVQDPVTHRWRNIPTKRATPLVDTASAWTAETVVASQRRRNGRSS